jgi:signal transduction histidine kinase
MDYAVTRALVESATTVEAALAILQTICITMGWDVGAIWEIDPQSNLARCIGVWQKPLTDAAEFEALGRSHVFSHGLGLPARVLASSQPQWITDLVESGALSRLTTTANENMRGGLGFPILAGNACIGILEFYSYEIRYPEQEMIQIMSSIGSHIGQLIQRKRAEDALNRSKEERLLELQRVRRRIATDLHDDVGSSLTKIALLSEAVRQNVTVLNKDAGERLVAVTDISNELMESMSDIVWAINPHKDNLSDLAQRMRRFASDIFTACEIGFRFRAPLLERDIQLGANVRREVFLIFKESVNNVVKHSESSEVILDLAIEGDWLALDISDNGKGFNPALVKADTGYLTSQSRGGNGLASMRRRARELGGQFDIKTNIGQGTIMSLRLPISHGVGIGE